MLYMSELLHKCPLWVISGRSTPYHVNFRFRAYSGRQMGGRRARKTRHMAGFSVSWQRGRDLSCSYSPATNSSEVVNPCQNSASDFHTPRLNHTIEFPILPMQKTRSDSSSVATAFSSFMRITRSTQCSARKTTSYRCQPTQNTGSIWGPTQPSQRSGCSTIRKFGSPISPATKSQSVSPSWKTSRRSIPAFCLHSNDGIQFTDVGDLDEIGVTSHVLTGIDADEY